MKEYKEIVANKIKSGEKVALYCYGILASHMLCCLEKFYGVLPTVVIDNDERKRGEAEFGVPVMPFADAQKEYEGLHYFICSDDFKYTIIGDLLEKGVQPEAIINYVPVEKRKTCLCFNNQMLISLTSREDGTQIIAHCNDDSFKDSIPVVHIPVGAGDYGSLKEMLDCEVSALEAGGIDACNGCAMNKEQYIVAKSYKKHYKQVVFHQESCSDCLCHCVYCCAFTSGGGLKSKPVFRLDRLGYYAKFVNQLFSLGEIVDDFNCLIDMSETNYDEKIGFVVDQMNRAGLNPMTYKVSSCLTVYSKNLENLLRRGQAYIIWSLDAGTRETYQKVKQIDGFHGAIENVKRYLTQDIFHGHFIVAKYLIVKGINDNEAEFDKFLKIVADLGLKYVSISFDFYKQADVNDMRFIERCNEKISNSGLQLTYKNNSVLVTEVLKMRNMLTQ